MRKNVFFQSLITSAFSIAPIILIVAVLSLSGLTPFEQNSNYLLLFIGMVVLILGLGIFSIGADKSLSKVGEYIGSSISKKTNLVFVGLVAFILGALITCAEPSITILSKQTPIPMWMFILFISLGVGGFVALGVIRVFKHKSLNLWLIAMYGLVFALMLLLDDQSVVPLIFDGGGATTGSATVPFLLALGGGVATIRGGQKNEDAFGLIGIASVGPLIMLVIMFIFARAGLGDYAVSDVRTTLNDPNVLFSFIGSLLPVISNGQLASFGTLLEVLLSIAPILIIFLVFQHFFLHLSKNQVKGILVGFIYSYLGLVIFLDGVESAMMPIGQYIGMELGSKPYWVIFSLAFVIGLVTILCEPAIHSLTKQIENVSSGSISKTSVLLTLSLGVGIAICLCAIRAVYNFSILYYIVPGFIIAIGLTFFCPKLYTALAFDSGGVASGPMTSSFVLPMIVGITLTLTNNDGSTIMYRAFGVIGMVALTPLIAIQILGIVGQAKKNARYNIFKNKAFAADDGQIITF